MTEAETKFRKARATLILDQPFFGRLLLKITPREDATCKTMWTDGVNAGFNPKYIDGLNMDELKTKICIQTLRLAAQHHCRRGERQQQTWDRAGEFTVTPILKNDKNDKGQDIFQLPKDALYSQQYENKEAEAIYKMLKEIEDKNQPPQNQPQQQPGPGQGSGKGKGKGKPQPGNDPGQGPPQPDPAGGEVRDLPGKDGQEATEAEKEQGRQDWKIATQQAAKIAKSCGKLPGELLRLVDDILEPVIDWKEALRQFVDRVSRNDYSWRRPNSRYMSSGVILPTLYNQELPPLVIAVDTSGSINQDELKQFAGEIDDILNQYPTTLTVIYCDTKIHPDGIEIFTAEDRPIKLNAKGGGGTEFSPVFVEVQKMEEPPACLVYLTDMECSDFGPEPDYPVLWVNTGKRCKQPPFGEMIRFKHDNH
jgi:predicted metal-dependent peptidase